MTHSVMDFFLRFSQTARCIFAMKNFRKIYENISEKSEKEDVYFPE